MNSVTGRAFDAVIVGGGIVGAACARELAEAGLRVAILEQSDRIGAGATSAAMGHLALMDDSEAQFALTRFSQILWRELANELPNEAEYVNAGSLWVADSGEELCEVERKCSCYRRRGVEVEKLDARQLAKAEPRLRKGLAGALFLPGDSICDPLGAARYLAARVLARGGEILLNRTVKRVTANGVELLDGDSIDAGCVILANGTAAPQLVPEIDVQSRKGHLLITGRYPGFLRHQVIELGYLQSAHASSADSVAFNVQPRQSGQILVGSSRQYHVDDPLVDLAILRKMWQRATAYLPDLPRLAAVRAWTGFRAATPDKLPLIGPCPGHSNVYLATGHEGLGISTSLGTARLLADEILGRDSAIPRTPYRPDRVSERLPETVQRSAH